MPAGVPRYPQFPLRIEPQIISKIRFIANENCRSTNKEIELLIRKHVAKWESENYEITIDDLRRMDD